MNTVKNFKPNTPGLRGRIAVIFTNLQKKKPEKFLTKNIKTATGRNNKGIITVRHRGGGHKRLYRKIEFKRTKIGIEGTIKSIEYDPNRNVNIALVFYTDGEKRYILHPESLNLGNKIITKDNTEIKKGNCLKLKNIPIGTEIHNLELYPSKGAQLIRAAGTSGRLLAKDNKFVIVRLPSKEVRLISENCFATIGRLSNSEMNLEKLGKAGRNRWLGRRPVVRGVVMNPCDHPHGGGEGRSPIGRSSPVTPWGKLALGVKTRKKNKKSNLFILKQRK
jgi:large subunit ribosomal protein L2